MNAPLGIGSRSSGRDTCDEARSSRPEVLDDEVLKAVIE